MAKAPKRKRGRSTGVLKELEPVRTPDTFQEVHSLSVVELNRLCKELCVPKGYSKSAKINLVCLSLALSTSGDNKENFAPVLPRQKSHGLSSVQLQEFQSLSPSYLATLADWSKDMSIIPDLDEATVKRYLKDTNILTLEMSRTYKLSRPFQLKQFVHSMRCHPLPSHPSFVAVQAQCNPSQSTSPENVKLMFMILDGVTGDPVGGYCTCTVGWDMLYMYTDILLWSANHLCTFFRNHSF